jgi:hypothetical protein
MDIILLGWDSKMVIRLVRYVGVDETELAQDMAEFACFSEYCVKNSGFIITANFLG